MLWLTQKKHTRFKDLTYRHYTRLYRFAFARLGNQQDAEDAVQEAYLKAYRAFDTLKDDSGVLPWLMQILINSIRDHIRKTYRQPKTVSTEDLPTAEYMDARSVEQKSVDPLDQICESEVDSRLLLALQELPEPFLAPLLLREVHDATYQGIADILGIPIGTVMSRLSRGRDQLRRHLSIAGYNTPSQSPSPNKSAEISHDDS